MHWLSSEAVVPELVNALGSGSNLRNDLGVWVSPLTSKNSTESQFLRNLCKHYPYPYLVKFLRI